VALTLDEAALLTRPWLLFVLVLCVLVLDSVELDLFGRGHVSPATVPTLVLAVLFGPAGPVLAEVVSVVVRLRHRQPLRVTALDFGILALAGIAAGATAQLLPATGAWPLLAAVVAAAAYYVVNALLLALAWGLDEGVNPAAAWRERLAWLAPHYLGYGLFAGLLILAQRSAGLYAFAFAGVALAVLWLGQKQYVDRTRRGVEELRESHAELEDANARLRALLDEKQDLLERIHRSQIRTVTALARTIEAKDPYTGGHTERVAEFSVALARRLGCEDADLDAVAIGGVIHDVGKVGIPDGVLLKPGRLDEEEWVHMRRHPEIASHILDQLEIPQIAKDIARHHHERYDGGGYPDGLAGEDIPLAARILAVADTLDAMTSHRPYRAARTLEEALEEIRRHVGTQFCPQVAEALELDLAVRRELWEGALQVTAGEQIPV